MSDHSAQVFYRPELDGLRAVAIIAVVLYHAGFGVAGGFVGVDVFFVLSGFLVTTLIRRDLEAGRFRLSHFWARRARRIAPAMIVMVLTTLLVGSLVMMPRDFAALGKATVSQAAFAANIYAYKAANYFDGASAEMPLAHTWSLAVEEQFYLVIPCLLWWLFHFRKWRLQGYTVIFLCLSAGLSLALSAIGVVWWPSATFYLLPTRAWELLCGSILVFLPNRLLHVESRVLREALCVIGLLLVFSAALLYSDSTLFPGLPALIPVGGSALVIVSNQRDERSAIPTIAGRLLAGKLLVFLGLISYSLYLWHWPLLAMARYVSLEPLTVEVRLLIVAVSIGISALSWRFIEKPFRAINTGAALKILAWTGVNLTVLLVLGLFVVLFDGIPARWSDQVVAYANASDDNSFWNEVSTTDIQAGRLPRLGIALPGQPPAVLIWGDSHAMAVMPAFDTFLRARRLSGVGVTHSSTAPVLSWYRLSRWGLGIDAPNYNQAVVNYAIQGQIKNVVMCSMWAVYLGKTDSEHRNFELALLNTIKKLESNGVQVWLLLDVPMQKVAVPKLLSRSLLTGQDITPFLATPKTLPYADNFSPEVLTAIQSTGAHILNPKDIFLSQSRTYYVVEESGVALYVDRHHLSKQGAWIKIVPFLENEMSRLGFEARHTNEPNYPEPK